MILYGNSEPRLGLEIAVSPEAAPLRPAGCSDGKDRSLHIVREPGFLPFSQRVFDDTDLSAYALEFELAEQAIPDSAQQSHGGEILAW